MGFPARFRSPWNFRERPLADRLDQPVGESVSQPVSRLAAAELPNDLPATTTHSVDKVSNLDLQVGAFNSSIGSERPSTRGERKAWALKTTPFSTNALLLALRSILRLGNKIKLLVVLSRPVVVRALLAPFFPFFRGLPGGIAPLPSIHGLSARDFRDNGHTRRVSSGLRLIREESRSNPSLCAPQTARISFEEVRYVRSWSSADLSCGGSPTSPLASPASAL